MLLNTLRKMRKKPILNANHSSGATDLRKQKAVFYTFTGYGLFSGFLGAPPD
jgi:hypothetical protein